MARGVGRKSRRAEDLASSQRLSAPDLSRGVHGIAAAHGLFKLKMRF
jgi:hypothetical protein